MGGARALAAPRARRRPPARRLPAPGAGAARQAARRRARARRRSRAPRGAPLALVNLGGGFGVDYSGGGARVPARTACRRGSSRDCADAALEWRLEPGRWLVAPVRRAGRRGAVGQASRRTALRRARRRHERPAPARALRRAPPHRAGARRAPARSSRRRWWGRCARAPTCSTTACALPPLEPGDLVAILDAGAYGAVMSSNYNGRGRLAELVVEGGLVGAPAPARRPRTWSRANGDPLASKTSALGARSLAGRLVSRRERAPEAPEAQRRVGDILSPSPCAALASPSWLRERLH